MADHKLWNEGVVLDSPSVDEGDEPFIEIRIVTLKAHLRSLAIDMAIDRGIEFNVLDESVSKILHTELTSVREFIEITEDYICVGVNCELIDDKVISDVWDLLSYYDELIPGTRFELGPMVHVYENKASSVKRTN